MKCSLTLSGPFFLWKQDAHIFKNICTAGQLENNNKYFIIIHAFHNLAFLELRQHSANLYDWHIFDKVTVQKLHI